ncbi:MAG: right-handed parallel beta-helix repeat-containing protein [Tannerella sp.]|jgi:hypothetical protein|nr:right-handed parallel beta-helix repeat-containing protein [Tannerella sp.]
MKKSVQVSIFIFALAATVQAQTTVSVADFGLKPDTRENAVPYVRKAIEHCREKGASVLTFPRGRYDFWPHHCIEREYFEAATQDINPKRLAILMEEMEGFAIDGDGSDFVFHDRMQPFTVDKCRDITVRNVSVDWDIPLTAQATVLRATDRYVDLQINAYESPYVIENGRLVFTGEGWKSEWQGFGALMEFERERRIVVPRGTERYLENEGYRAEELSKGTVRLHAAYRRTPAVGNLLVLRHSVRDHSGIFIIDSKDVRVENVNLYHYPGLGVLAQYSENLTCRNLRCVPNEKKGRILSGHDDGIQVSNCRGDVRVDSCEFHALMDDPINVYGVYVRIVEKKDDYTLRCQIALGEMHGLHWARPGETVSFIDGETMQSTATGAVKSFRRTDPEYFELTFREAVPKQAVAGNALENLDWRCNSVTVTNSRFKSCRARGLLVTSPGRVVIADNIFESSGSAILMECDLNHWYLSAPVNDVLITKNIFKSPCMTSMYQYTEAVISIYPQMSRRDAKLPPYNKNIVITDNEFHLFDYPVLYALSVDGIEFSNNRLVRSYDFEPFHARKDGLTFECCRNISIKGNTVEGDVPGKTVKLVQTPRRECRMEKSSFFRIGK